MIGHVCDYSAMEQLHRIKQAQEIFLQVKTFPTNLKGEKKS